MFRIYSLTKISNR